MKILYKTDRLLICKFDRDFLKEIKSNYQDWFYDEEITKNNHHGLFPYGKKEFENYLDMCETCKKDIVFAIVVRKFEEGYWFSDEEIPIHLIHIGNISLQRINQIYRSAEFAIVMDNKYHNQGYATEALKKLLEHGFKKLNLHRIWSGTAETNIGMLKVFEKLGMQQEGVFREAMFINGNYRNILCYSILENEYYKGYCLNENKFCKSAKKILSYGKKNE